MTRCLDKYLWGKTRVSTLNGHTVFDKAVNLAAIQTIIESIFFLVTCWN